MNTKTLLIAALSLMLWHPVIAQDSLNVQENDRSYKFSSYFGVGLLYTDALDINPLLSERNVPSVRRFPVELSFGFINDFGKNRIDAEFGFYSQEREDAGLGHEVLSGTISIRYLRNLIQFKDNNKVYLGAAINYNWLELEFFDENSSLDLEDPDSFGEVAKLNNSQFYISPSLGYSIYSSDGNKEYIRVQLSYDINLSANNWESRYTRVINSLDETGNRWRLQVIFPF